MDKSQRKDILLGLFVIGAIVLFIIGIFMVGSKDELFTKTITVTSTFNNASGLKPGSNVRFNGVKVGIVKSVSLASDTLVRVIMQIEESKCCYITSDAVATITSDGLMGDKIITIVTGKKGGAPISENDAIQSNNPLMADQMLQMLNKTNDNVNAISENLVTLTNNLNNGNGIIQDLYKDQGMATDLRQSFNNLDMITQKVLTAGAALQQITAQIEHGKGLAGELVADTTLGRELSYTIDRLKQTSDQVNHISVQLSQTVQQATSGKGTFGVLLGDTTIAFDIRQSMANVKTATEKLDSNMEALKHNFLTRGYFRKIAKQKEDK